MCTVAFDLPLTSNASPLLPLSCIDQIDSLRPRVTRPSSPLAHACQDRIASSSAVEDVLFLDKASLDHLNAVVLVLAVRR